MKKPFTDSCRENQMQNFLVSTVFSSVDKWEKELFCTEDLFLCLEVLNIFGLIL